MRSVFCAPSRYVQGDGVMSHLPSELELLGIEGPVLIVASNSSKNFFQKVWEKSFLEAKRKYAVHLLEKECSMGEIEKIKQEAKGIGAKAIVGCGGGKVIDAAQSAAMMLKLYFISGPSIASSDAPCSALSVVYTDEGEVSEYLIHCKNPDLVLVDTRAIANAPRRFLVAGMGDALATLFEAKTCYHGHKENMRGGAPSLSAIHLANLCYQTLLDDGEAACLAVDVKSICPALERIVEANTLLSGIGFESCGLAAAHAIHNGLTMLKETHDYLHGEKVAFGTLVQLVLEGAPIEKIDEVMHFSTRVGLPITLAEIGLEKITKEQLDLVAKRTLQKGETIYNEPLDLSKPLVCDAIRAADALGRRAREEYS